MFELWLGIAGLTILALVLLMLPFMVSMRGSEAQRKQNNIAIYKAQLRDLEADLQEQRITQVDFDSLSQEIKLNFLDDTEDDVTFTSSHSGRWILIPSSVLMVFLSVGLYLHLGSENELAITQALQASNQSGFTQEDANELIERIKQQTQDTPQDTEMWYLYARLSFDLERYDDAVTGFTTVLQLLPVDAKQDQAVAMSHLAQATFFAEDRKLDAATQSLLKDVLAINPNDETALGLLGISSFDAQNYVDAVKYWQQLLNMMPVNNPNVAAIQDGINTAMSRMTPEEREKIEVAMAAVQPAAIQITVDIDDAIKAKVPETADVFVLAKAKDGPPMPLAVQRLSVTQWPITLVLDDSMAMMPALRLSQFENVKIIARISKSGVGNAKPGDLEGESAVISSQTKQTSVTISTEL